LSITGGEATPFLQSGLPSHLLTGDIPCPSSPSHGFFHHTIGSLKNAEGLLAITVLEMLKLFFRGCFFYEKVSGDSG
jgi:hypothetical protein